MSREELLVLRKTLADLLDKGWVRACALPASLPVFFAKKLTGGLKLFFDYRGLNAIVKNIVTLHPLSVKPCINCQKLVNLPNSKFARPSIDYESSKEINWKLLLVKYRVFLNDKLVHLGYVVYPRPFKELLTTTCDNKLKTFALLISTMP